MTKCRHCKQPTTNKIGLRYLCNIDHAIAYTKSEAERKQLKQKAETRKNERKELAKRKEKIKPLSAWLREAQTQFNAYIRARDATEPCISCGRLHGGKWNAGHYRSVGAASHLRFNEHNVHKQCEPCNSHLSGNIANYRPRLASKIGLAALESIENDNTPHKYTIEEVAAIKKEYAAKCREIIRQAAE